jgi:hypothetical protein
VRREGIARVTLSPVPRRAAGARPPEPEFTSHNQSCCFCAVLLDGKAVLLHGLIARGALIGTAHLA